MSQFNMDPGLVYQPQGKAHHYVNNVKILNTILFLLNLFWDYFNEFLHYIVKHRSLKTILIKISHLLKVLNTYFNLVIKYIFCLFVCLYYLFFVCFFYSVNVSQFTSVKLVAKLVTHAGNSTVWNMESSLMVKCPLTN